MEQQTFFTILSLSYLIGSIPTAYIIGRLHGINIFEVGSGNMGANNTARALGFKWGVLVWFLDGTKGLSAMLLARQLVPADQNSAAMILAAVAAVFGHNWSFFATMITGTVRGGKGAATASGTWLLLVSPVIIAVAVMLWAIIVAATRYVSLAVLTIIAVVSMVIVATALIRESDPIYVAYLLVPIMVFYRHKTNIRAILSGTERRFGDRAQT
ncbi:MAG: glycerol-3-phosphate acyltransferase [Anaerolineales bacterium]|nr:glycerol-3-phosphate acyltransferase [Anaerolineales bacterium]